LPRQSPTLPRGLEGGNPLCVKIFLEKRLPLKRLLRLPAMSVTEPQETNKGACKWQGRPSRGTPTPLGYGYLTRRLPRKMTLTWASYPATDERVWIRKTEGEETQPYITIIRCSGLDSRKRHICIQRKLLRQNQASPREGAAPLALSPPSARSAQPRTTAQAGGSLPRRWLLAPRLGPRRPRRASRLRPGRLHLRREAIPLADPLQIHVIVGGEHDKGPPDAVMQRLAESATRMVTQGLQATLRGASRGDVVKSKDLAEARDGLGHGRVVGLPLLGRLNKRLGGLIKGRLELCE
jgi:hypothetical protein